jgi:hypothetical protein
MPGAVLADLLLARVRQARGRWLVVSAGVALCTVLPVLVATVTALTAQAALRTGLAELPPGDRSVVVSYNGFLDASQAARLDAAVRRRLPALTGLPIRRQLIFRPISDGHGGAFVLGAADGLPGAVRLVDGRLPASCTPSRCEVVEVVTPGTPARATGYATTAAQALGVVVVGRVVRAEDTLLSGTFDPGRGVPLLLADGVDDAARLASLSVFQRSYGWAARLDLSRVRTLGVPGWLSRGSQVADALWLDEAGLVLTTPDDVLRSEDARVRASARRFALLGGATAVLLLGTAVAGGAAVRRDHTRFIDALRRRGARRGQIGVLVAGEVAVTVLAGVVAGLLVAGGLAAAMAAGARLPVLPTAATALAAAMWAVIGLAAAAGILLALTLTWPVAASGGARGVWRAVEGAAVACLATAALLAARGGVSASGPAGDGASGRTDPLAAVAAGARPARRRAAAGPGVAAAGPMGAARVPRRAVAARLGISAVTARPLRPVATAAMLAAAVAATVFAASYRATLDRGAADQAAFAVPLDARVRVGDSLQRPLDVAPPAAYAAAAGTGGAAYGVLRLAGSVRTAPTESAAVQVIGVPRAVLPRIARWPVVTGDRSSATVARRIAVPAAEAGVALPAGRRLRVLTPGSPVVLAVTAWVRTADGRERAVPLAVSRSGGQAALVGELPELAGAGADPAAPAPLRLIALQAQQATDEATIHQHALGESTRDVAVPAGRITFGAADVDGRPVGTAGGAWSGWSGLKPVAPGEAVLDYRLTTGQVLLTAPGLAPPPSPLPVAVDPATAAGATGGMLTIVLDSVAVPARVVATLPRFPTVSGRFAVADVDAVGLLADRTTPGSGEPGEVWVSGPRVAQGMASARFAGLDIGYRSQVAERLRADPVARGAIGLLQVGAWLALAVAMLGLVLLVLTERRDDAGELYSWEADGVSPATLRGALWWRAAAVALPAVPAGVLIGVGLTRLTARLVAVTATAGVPQPPLAAAGGGLTALGAAAAGVALALAVAGLVAARALREPVPVGARWMG